MLACVWETFVRKMNFIEFDSSLEMGVGLKK
jgi:hypothetical protein